MTWRCSSEASDRTRYCGRGSSRGDSGIVDLGAILAVVGGVGMKGFAQLMSSKTDDWSTPQTFFDDLNREFGFTVDVCASDDNAKCERYFTQADDGLQREWYGVCWMNPPYGKEVGKWVEKAYKASLAGVTVVCLLPARTDTRWFHSYCLQGELRWVKGRLRFGGHKNPATFPSVVCIFRGAK